MNLTFDVTPIGGRPALEGLVPRPAPGDLRWVADACSGSADGIARLAQGAPCVTTGQQPGLLTGPLYTLFKAVSAMALARRLDAVPVFWVAGDDHDFAEGNHCHLLTADHAVERLTLRERPDTDPLTPLYRERVGAGIAAVLAAVEAHTPATEFRADILASVSAAYRPEADLAGAFAACLADWLAPHGLVVLHSTHPAAKRAMMPWVLRALEHAERIEQGLVDGAAALAAAGRPVPVHVGDHATLVMLEGDLGRDRLVAQHDDFVLRRSGERVCLDDVRALAGREPERLSPNVLLRPVVEAAILPTIAYLGGPGELDYFPQCDPVYAALDIVPQARRPRWSARIVEGRVQKVLDKYGLAAADLTPPEGALEARLVRDDLPPAAAEAMATLRVTLEREYARLREAAVQVDATLRKPVESQRGQALGGVADIEKRLIQHLKQQNEILVQQLAKARASLFPGGKPQERVLNGVPYLVRYGRALIPTLIEQADAWIATWSGSSPR